MTDEDVVAVVEYDGDDDFDKNDDNDDEEVGMNG